MEKIILTGEQFGQLVKGKTIVVSAVFAMPSVFPRVEIELAPMTYSIMLNHIQNAIESDKSFEESSIEPPRKL